MHFDVKAEPADQFATWIEQPRATPARPSTPQATSPLRGRASNGVHSPSARSNPGCSQKIVTLQLPPGPGPQQADLFEPGIGLINPHICSPKED